MSGEAVRPETRFPEGERREEFRLAPMSPSVRALTMSLWMLPLVSLALSRVGVAVVLVGAYLGVWLLARPLSFVLTARGLRITWPIRALTLPWSEIQDATVLPARTRPSGLRVGVGGLWGTFGWIVQPGQKTSEIYASRADGRVLLRRVRRSPLVLTPEDPDRFAAAVRRLLVETH